MKTTSAGTTLHVIAGNPATYDAAGYATLFGGTEKLVGEITDLGEFGREYATVTTNVIASRGTQKYKGSFNEGQMSLTLDLDTDDEGQILMKTALNSDSDYSFQVTLPSGDVYYFQAKVMSWKIGGLSNDSMITATCNLELTTNSAGVGIVEVLAA